MLVLIPGALSFQRNRKDDQILSLRIWHTPGTASSISLPMVSEP
jgi:hypothetical protein